MTGYQWVREYMRVHEVSTKDAIAAYNRVVAWPKQCAMFRRQLGRWS